MIMIMIMMMIIIIIITSIKNKTDRSVQGFRPSYYHNRYRHRTATMKGYIRETEFDLGTSCSHLDSRGSLDATHTSEHMNSPSNCRDRRQQGVEREK